MTSFATKRLPVSLDEVAPDGSEVRVLLGLEGGVMAHYELAPGHVSTAVTDRRVEEIWFFLSGLGEMWRMQDGREEIVIVEPGVCVSIPWAPIFNFVLWVMNLYPRLV
jgi:mannose-6-phosphate isomerase-like protein (cupin superfamily)